MSSLSPSVTPGDHWVTATDHSSVISVVAWVLIVTLGLAVFTRLATRFAVLRTIYIDDFTITVALIVAIGQTVAASIQAAAGSGKPIDTLTTAQIHRFEKAHYAADMLYIVCILFVKISVTLYLYALTPVTTHRTIASVIGAVIVAWSIASLLVVAFECPLPHPWEVISSSGKCVNVVDFFTFYNVFNIVTDLFLIILPFFILAGLQMRLRRKVLVLACFGARLFVVAATIAQIYYLRHDQASNPADPTLASWRTTLCSQIVITSSVMTACAPYLKPFLEALDTGMLNSDSLPRAMGYGPHLEYPAGSVLMSMAGGANGPSDKRRSRGIREPMISEKSEGQASKHSAGHASRKSTKSGLSGRLRHFKERHTPVPVITIDSKQSSSMTTSAGSKPAAVEKGQLHASQIYGAHDEPDQELGTRTEVTGGMGKRLPSDGSMSATARHHHEQSSDLERGEAGTGDKPGRAASWRRSDKSDPSSSTP